MHSSPQSQRISNSYPQLQWKIEAYNKLRNNEFMAVEDIPNIDDGKLRYDMFAKAYNEAREHEHMAIDLEGSIYVSERVGHQIQVYKPVINGNSTAVTT